MVTLSGTFSRFKSFKALVIGDFMLDTYMTGKVKRISPEAPVPVMNVEKEESRPGGAGNVVLGLISLGGSVTAMGRIGEDIDGAILKNCLEEEQVNTAGLIAQKGYKTPVKKRLIASSQQILRVDLETVDPLPTVYEDLYLQMLPSLLEDTQIVAISDYAKGFLSRNLLSHIISYSRKRNIPVIVDPKGQDFTKYTGAYLIKPNLSEAYAAAKALESDPLDKVAEVLLSKSEADKLVITRSEAGITLFEKDGERRDFPVRSKEVKDVTGAGDTVLAMLSSSIANGLEISHAVQLANIAAGLAIERIGCARITLSELARRLLEYDSENKIFEEGHIFALQQALQGQSYTVLGLDSTSGLPLSLFQTIRELSQKKGTTLILYLKDAKPDPQMVNLLSSLQEVDFIVLKKESLQKLCESVHPDEVFIIEQGKVVELLNLNVLLSK